MRNEAGIRLLAEDIAVSNDTRITGLNNNDLIIGSSGSGKTGGYVIPNIQNISGSLVVTDTKGQLSRLFRNKLREKGYNVYTLDFVDPERSCGYNPLRAIRRKANGKYREQDILSLANAIMPDLDSSEPFWEKAATSYIAFLIAFCLEALDRSEHDLVSVCELHRSFSRQNEKNRMKMWTYDNPDAFAAKKFSDISASSVADKMWGSIMEFANQALEPFSFDEAGTIFRSRRPFDIDLLGREKTVLFINVSDTDRTFDHLVNVFYTQALQLLCGQADANPGGRLDVPVRIIMDDFAAGAKIPNFDKVISVIRSREISVSIILQSITQLESMYNKAEASTIINNCDHLLYLGNQDIGTAEFIGSRAFRTPEKVLCMPNDQAILITKGEKAQFVNKIRPYSTMTGGMRLFGDPGRAKEKEAGMPA